MIPKMMLLKLNTRLVRMRGAMKRKDLKSSTIKVFNFELTAPKIF